MGRKYPVRIFKCTDEEFPPSLVSAWLKKIEEVAPPPEEILGETDIEGLRLDFNCGLRLQVPYCGGDLFHVVIGNAESGEIYFDEEVSGVVLVSFEKYFMPWQIDVFFQEAHIFSHTFDLDGQEVFISFLSKALGDGIVLLPYVSEFIKRWNCRPRVKIAPYLQPLAAKYYPRLKFSDTAGEMTYATYTVGTWMNFLAGSTVDNRVMPMENIGKTSLGIPYTLRTVRFVPARLREIVEPYVCIGVQASAPWKGWQYPGGWDEVVAHLKKSGYRVLCIDRERENVRDGIVSKIPDGAEDFTGNLPLLERVNLLAYADFFIGLGSGLSWLAYAAGCPVVMIVGFTLPWYEFDTPYRVQNFTKCYGCFNDVRAEVVHWEKCPFHQGTEKKFECMRSITPQQVISTIERLREDYPEGSAGRMEAAK